MMRLFLNGLAASAGGGLTYFRNVLPHLSARGDVYVTAALPPQLRQELSGLPRVMLPEIDLTGGGVGRFWREQTSLPAMVRRSGADVLVSAGNVALRNSPVPQILLSRNSLYTSSDFLHDLRRRREYGLWFDTRIKGILARRSILWADSTVAPTEAFAQDLRRWTRSDVVAIHHGFDSEAFFFDQTPLPPEVRRKLGGEKDELRLLYVSHYNYYRNFETLFHALPLLHERLGGRKLKLFLTCRLGSHQNPGSYRAQAASALIAQLGIGENVVELGEVSYPLLHQLYRECSLYVTPAYAESFAHPLVEAMASGLPVVAADSAVHREICQDAALYFPRFSAEELAARVCEVAASSALSRQLSDRGRERSRDFSWNKHVDELLALAVNLLATIDPVGTGNWASSFSDLRVELLHQRYKDLYFLLIAKASWPNYWVKRLRHGGGSVNGHRLDLHLGCGTKYLPGFVNIDANPMQKTDVWLDVRCGLPFAAGSVDSIYSTHMIEHLYPDELERLLCECARVLKAGGGMRVIVPSLSNAIAAFQQNRHDWFYDDFPRHFDSLGGRFSNFIFCDGQHRTAFDFSYLDEILRKAGFREVLESTEGESRLYGETVPAFEPGDAAAGLPHSVYVEAFK